MATLLGADGAGIDRRHVEKTLQNILASEQFASSGQLADFLDYIVNKTLDGNPKDIKAYSIAVDALGKSEDFDPQSNAAVRVAAGRLRQSLALYNASDIALSDSIRISLEPGSYIPSFAAQEVEIPPEPVAVQERPVLSDTPAELEDSALKDAGADTYPIVASRKVMPWVMPVFFGFCLALFGVYIAFKTFDFGATQTPFVVEKPSKPQAPEKLAAARAIDSKLRPTIIATLLVPDAPYPDWFNPGETANAMSLVVSRFDDYRFNGIRMSQEYGAPDKRSADYHLLVIANKRGDSVRVFGRLIREKSGTIIWSAERKFERPETLSGRNVPDIVGRLFAGVGSPYGVIYADLIRNKNTRGELNCVIEGYQYFNRESVKKHAAARSCAEELIESGTELPSIHAMLTFLYLDEFRRKRNSRKRDPIRAASAAARRAIELGPKSARAHQAMFAVHKVQGNHKEAQASAERALQLNPYDTDIIGDYAAWLISTGNNDKGRELITRVEGMLDARPAWLEFYRFLGAELAREFNTADDISRLMDMKRSPLVAIAVVIGSHRRGERRETDRAIVELVRAEPGFAVNPKMQLLNRGFSEPVAEQVVERLKEAGLEVRPEG